MKRWDQGDYWKYFNTVTTELIAEDLNRLDVDIFMQQSENHPDRKVQSDRAKVFDTVVSFIQMAPSYMPGEKFKAHRDKLENLIDMLEQSLIVFQQVEDDKKSRAERAIKENESIEREVKREAEAKVHRRNELILNALIAFGSAVVGALVTYFVTPNTDNLSRDISLLEYKYENEIEPMKTEFQEISQKQRQADIYINALQESTQQLQKDVLNLMIKTSR